MTKLAAPSIEACECLCGDVPAFLNGGLADAHEIRLFWKKMVLVAAENHELCPAGSHLKSLFPFTTHSAPPRKARALYACKAEHDSELSFIAGTIFDNGEFPRAQDSLSSLYLLNILFVTLMEISV